MNQRGRVVSWNDRKGFGFIQSTDGGQRLFFHIKAVAGGTRCRPSIGDRVRFRSGRDAKGRLQAAAVAVSGCSPRRNTQTAAALGAMGLTLGFLSLLGVGVIRQSLSAWVLKAYLVISAIALVLYQLDKLAAVKGRRRMPENTLHVISLLGGWPGAMLARQVLRHKTKKQPFRKVFWVTVALNLSALLVWQMS